jgi:hypothetical protein
MIDASLLRERSWAAFRVLAIPDEENPIALAEPTVEAEVC